MPGTTSIKQNLLNSIASFTAGNIAKVRINNSLIITDFEVKQATQNNITVEYAVFEDSEISEISKIELLDSTDNILAEALVFVPIVESVLLKHTIQVTEGA